MCYLLLYFLLQYAVLLLFDHLLLYFLLHYIVLLLFDQVFPSFCPTLLPNSTGWWINVTLFFVLCRNMYYALVGRWVMMDGNHELDRSCEVVKTSYVYFKIFASLLYWESWEPVEPWLLWLIFMIMCSCYHNHNKYYDHNNWSPWQWWQLSW